MHKRIIQMTGKKPNISTIHSFAANFIREYPPDGFTNNFHIVEERQQYNIVKNLVKKYKIDKHPRYIIEKLTLIRNLRDSGLLKQEGLEKFYKDYFNHLKSNNSIDFDGLLSLCLVTLENNQNALKSYKLKFKYILVDEFQDISPIQYKILRLLAGGYNNLFCVGDFDQSIYRFRGADVNIMLNLEKDFHDVKRYYLEQNYRSTKQIVKAANNLISYNINRQDKPHWSDNYEGDAPSIIKCKNVNSEASLIASKIKEEVKKGKNYESFAILFRINALSQAIEIALSNQNIPYQIIGGVGYFQRREIQDIICFLKLAENPDDTEAYSRAKLVLSNVSPDFKETFLNDLLDNLKKQVQLQDAYKLLMQETGYLDYLKLDISSEGERRIENVESLDMLIDRFPNTSNSLSEFLRYIEKTNVDIDNDDSVKLLTFHSAKGLEFDTVFIFGATKGLIPHYKAELPQAVEEERRMLYVAITRASNKLFITYPQFNGKISVDKSPFLNEINKLNIVSGEISGLHVATDNVIEHNKWGKGKVISIYKNHKNEEEIKVLFNDKGLKTLLLKYAPIKVIK